MSASPLILTYNYPGTSVLDNIFLDASGSPLPGISDATLCILQSPNINLQGITLTFQFYDNLATPPTGAKTNLIMQNLTVIASSATNTLGTLSWTQQYQNPLPGKDPLVSTTRVAKLSSLVHSASGIFTNYLFGNVITQFNNTTRNRVIRVYSAE